MPQSKQPPISTSSTGHREHKVFVRGIGSAIPGIGDIRLHNGNAGTLLHASDICGLFLDDYNAHNPKTGKKIDLSWALRNLGVETISIGNIGTIRAIQDMTTLDTPLTKEMKSISETELAFVAFDEALERSNLKAKDIDVILRLSHPLRRLLLGGTSGMEEKVPGPQG